MLSQANSKPVYYHWKIFYGVNSRIFGLSALYIEVIMYYVSLLHALSHVRSNTFSC